MNLKQQIEKAAEGHGHGCMCDACAAEYVSGDHYGLDKVLFWRIIAAAVLFAASAILKNAMPAVSVILAIISILTAGYDVFVRTIAACVRNKLPDEDLLMCVAAVAAVAIGRAPEGALVLLLMQLGTLFRGFAEEKVRRSVHSVADIRVDPTDPSRGNSRAQEFITHFAHIYTPVILGLAVLFAVVLPLFFRMTVSEAIHKALVLLVIACPCAFVISIPLTYFAGVGGAARNGILFRDDAAMTELCRVGTVVFDKTGALQGEGSRVVSVKSDRMDAETLLRIAAHACAYADSEPAESIKAAYQGTIYIELIQSFRQDSEHGITVVVDGVDIILGTEEFIRDHGVDPGSDATTEPSAYLAIDGQYAGRIVFGAVAKADSARTVQLLSWENERQILLLSDETAAATEKFARSVGIGRFYSDCTGGKKAATLRDIQERKARRGSVLFVGDAQADPECFAEAELGAAMYADGSENAAVMALNDSPLSIVSAIGTARQTNTILRQNILFALVFKLIVLILDIVGICPLWLAVFSDSGVTLMTVLNCLRAMTVKETQLSGE
ncbi:MAG: HAD-IC family P-type ATPase [Oscillospiraceae bacterium]